VIDDFVPVAMPPPGEPMPPISLGAKRALKTNDNRQWTPVECLLDCLNDIQSGKTSCNKLLVLRLDTDDGGEKFSLGYHAANIKASEILAALEVAKAIILQEMGYAE
jgi:hypothetical protein